MGGAGATPVSPPPPHRGRRPRASRRRRPHPPAGSDDGRAARTVAMPIERCRRQGCRTWEGSSVRRGAERRCCHARTAGTTTKPRVVAPATVQAIRTSGSPRGILDHCGEGPAGPEAQQLAGARVRSRVVDRGSGRCARTTGRPVAACSSATAASSAIESSGPTYIVAFCARGAASASTTASATSRALGDRHPVRRTVLAALDDQRVGPVVERLEDGKRTRVAELPLLADLAPQVEARPGKEAVRVEQFVRVLRMREPQDRVRQALRPLEWNAVMSSARSLVRP